MYMDKWLYFFISVGSIFVMVSPTTDGQKEFLFLGLFLIVASAITLFVKRKK